MNRLFLAIVSLLAVVLPANAGAFCVHFNNVDQTGYAVGVYSPLTGWTEKYDTDARFNAATGLWSPVAVGEPTTGVQFGGQLWITNALGSTGFGIPNYVLRVVKNPSPGLGGSLGADIGSEGEFANTDIIAVNQEDRATAGDTFGFYLFSTNTSAAINGHPLHSFICGHTFAL